ncbi:MULTISPECIES: hypothetical protein [Halorussus]|uniref:hypothetical protein n=1 Tax=Halorussus TaxID=1070314 RepID=UPI000E211682|nr:MULTISPECIES: hypothetical protein [Halorussus]NHN59956.1 hypothetical protein [Halorussus sp. JP-T4]
MRPDDCHDAARPARRRLLALGGSALVGSLAGCTSSLSVDDGPPDVREVPGLRPDSSAPSAMPTLSAESTLTTLAVGRGGNNHPVTAWNVTDRSRDVALEIAGEGDAEPWFRGEYALDADTNLIVDLRDPRHYAVTVRVGERSKTVDVPKSRFDCNNSATDVAIREDGIESRSISTSMACGGL